MFLLPRPNCHKLIFVACLRAVRIVELIYVVVSKETGIPAYANKRRLCIWDIQKRGQLMETNYPLSEHCYLRELNQLRRKIQVFGSCLFKACATLFSHRCNDRSVEEEIQEIEFINRDVFVCQIRITRRYSSVSTRCLVNVQRSTDNVIWTINIINFLATICFRYHIQFWFTKI